VVICLFVCLFCARWVLPTFPRARRFFDAGAGVGFQHSSARTVSLTRALAVRMQVFCIPTRAPFSLTRALVCVSRTFQRAVFLTTPYISGDCARRGFVNEQCAPPDLRSEAWEGDSRARLVLIGSNDKELVERRRDT
jgi:hypothetical protein